MSAKLLAICTSTNKGLPKYPQPVATVGTWGLEGDCHNKPARWSYRRAIAVPNVDRHILLLDQETRLAIADTTSIFCGKDKFLEHGSLSENLLVEGLNEDLLELVGREVVIGDGAIILRVLEPAQPCKHVRARYGIDAYTALMNRRGMYCSIGVGKGCQILPGDRIEVV